MITYATEPERCKACRSTQKMSFHNDLVIDGIGPKTGWLCQECGHCHLKEGPIEQRATIAGTHVVMKPVQCPNSKCGSVVDAATPFNTRATPAPGDISVCAECGTPGVLTETLSLRLAVQADFDKLTTNERLEILGLISSVNEMRERQKKKQSENPEKTKKIIDLVTQRSIDLGYSRLTLERALATFSRIIDIDTVNDANMTELVDNLLDVAVRDLTYGA